MRLRRPVPGTCALVLAILFPACGGGDATSPPPAMVATTLQVMSGSGQSAAVASALPAPVVVQVNDQNGAPLGGASVAWAVSAGGGTLSAGSTPTGANGRAQVIWTLGRTSGAAQGVTATVSGVAPVAITAVATTGAPASVAALGGNAQTGSVAAALAQPLVARVQDAHGNAIAGVTVTFSAAAGNGAVAVTDVVSNATGQVQAGWVLGTTAGAQSVTATAAGLPPLTFTATAMPAAAATMTLTPLAGSLTTGDTIRAAGDGIDQYGNATALPTVTWSSSDDGVAAVSTTGLIRGITAGTTQITASATALPGITAAVNVTVVGAPLPAFNLDIAGMYVTQSTQTMGGAVPLVAGRDGLVRVFVRGNLANSAAPAVRLRIFQNGTLADTRTIPSPAASTPTSVTEGTLLSSWNYRVPGAMMQPGISILADVDNGNAVPENDESDNVYPSEGTSLALDVRIVPTLGARFVPITQPDATTGDVTAANKDSYTSFASALYPFSSIDSDVHAPYSFDKMIPADYDSIWSRLLLEIEALRSAEGSLRYYYGVFDPAYTQGGSGVGYVGNNSTFWRAAIGVDMAHSIGDHANTSWRAMTVAHEWGHNFGRIHVDCGGPSSPDPLYPHAGGALGREGWDARNNTLLPRVGTFDIMSYCMPAWASGYTYSAVLSYHMTATGRMMAAPEPSLLIWGRTTPDGGVILEPAFQITASPSTPNAAGRFRVEATDATGASLFEMSFDGQQVDHLGTRHFSYMVPMSALRGRELATLRVTTGRAQAVQRSGPALAMGPGSDDVRATRMPNGRVRLEWDAARTPMLLVRDPRTGEVLSFARGGSHTIVAPGTELDLNMSNGVRSTDRKVRIQ